MTTDLMHKLNDVLHEIEFLSKEYREDYNSAVDIEDLEMAKSVQDAAFEKIRHTKEWKTQIETLKASVSSVATQNDNAEIPQNTSEEMPIYENENSKSNYATHGYTNKEPISITLFGKKVPVRFWNEVLIKVCEAVLLRKPYVVAKFDKTEMLNSENRINFSYTESDIKFNRKMLSNGLYIETNRSANDIVSVSEKILKLCGYDASELVLEYK